MTSSCAKHIKSCYLFRKPRSNFHVRHVSSLTHTFDDSPVIISTSKNIFSNLAFEDWLFKNCSFSRNEFKLLLWRNHPAVVIGRHQNPWLECNWKHLSDIGVSLARRNSGGGTVYHDLGNLNLCFISKKKLYNRKQNLEFLSKVLKENWDCNVNISEREDLVVNDIKISGTAARLTEKNCYHHCTLLVDVDMDKLHSSLYKNNNLKNWIKSNATESIRSRILNMKSLNQSISYESLIKVISEAFLNTYNLTGDVLKIDPSQMNLPQFKQTESDLMSWDWIFGKTPKFCCSQHFTWNHSEVNFEITTFRGRICELKLTPCILHSSDLEKLKNICYHKESIQELVNSLDVQSDPSVWNFVLTCVQNIIQDT